MQRTEVDECAVVTIRSCRGGDQMFRMCEHNLQIARGRRACDRSEFMLKRMHASFRLVLACVYVQYTVEIIASIGLAQRMIDVAQAIMTFIQSGLCGFATVSFK